MTTEPSNRDRTAPRKVWSVYYLVFPENGCQPCAVTEQSTVTILSPSLTIRMERDHKLEFAFAGPFSSRWGERREMEGCYVPLTNMYPWLPFPGHWPEYAALFHVALRQVGDALWMWFVTQGVLCWNMRCGGGRTFSW